MNVLYDYQIVNMQKYGGISRYFYELIKRIQKLAPESKFELCTFSSINYYFEDIITTRKPIKKGNHKLNVFFILIKLFLWSVFKKDIILCPTYYYADYLFKRPWILKKFKIIVVIHDMIYERYIKADIQTIEAKKKMLHLADGIISVSEYTKQDMLNIYPKLSQKPIRVIYHGYNVISANPEKIDNLPPEYVLSIGRREGYKNFILLLDCFTKLHQNHPNLKLFCGGGGEFVEKEIREIEERNLQEVVIQEDLSDGELITAYREALCFVFPSLYEGFGIPILEAFANECPICLYNGSCFPEIAGDAAIYFKDKEDLEAAIIKIKDDMNFRKELVAKGKERLQRYSWDKAVRETLDFYKEILV